MSNPHHLLARPVAALIAPPAAAPPLLLAALLACAPRGAPSRDPAPARAVADTATPPRLGGRTVENLFVGRFPGVTVTPTDGGGLQIRIRGGNNSFYGSNEPLYVLDDTPLPEASRGIVFLNPYDIEKIEVLKNPADIGVYGVRGANGVIRITTLRPGRR